MAAGILSANAATITIDSTTSWATRTTNQPVAFDASSSDKLVVVATAEHGFNNTNGTVNGVTYNGQALTAALERDPVTNGSDITYTSIWYLDNPGSFAGTGEIQVAAVNREIVTVLALSNTLADFGATATGNQGDLSIGLTTTAANSLVVANLGMGGNGNTGNTDNTDTTSPLLEVAAPKDASNWLGHVTGQQEVAAAGANTFAFTTDQGGGYVPIAVEFLAVPEPSSLAFLGLGGLALLRRRR